MEKSKESRRHWTKARKEAILREYDHGSDSLAVYRALETVRLGRHLGLKSCYTAHT